MKQTVAFIIVAFRPQMEEFTKLLKLLKDHLTIIVDNGGTLTLDDVGRATLLSQTKNLGYGAAANIGIHHASGLGATWFVILNQDVHISKDAVKLFVKHLKKLPPCVAGPWGGGLDPKRWTTLLPSRKAEYVTGACMAIHKKVVGKIGYFYEPYGMYYEDADYSVRAAVAGFPLIVLDIEGITHTDSTSLSPGSRLHTYYLARNHLLFVKRLAPTSMKLREFLRLPKTLLEHAMRKEKGAIHGVTDFLFRRFGMVRKGAA